jgi:hypothetical protein
LDEQVAQPLENVLAREPLCDIDRQPLLSGFSFSRFFSRFAWSIRSTPNFFFQVTYPHE